jgi:Zn-dependent protease with chaperone function
VTRRAARRPARHERRHRHAVYLGIAILLALGVAPVLGHHLPIGLEDRLAGRDHLATFCLIALHLLLAPVHGLFHLLAAAGLGYAVWDRVRAWHAQREALRALHAERPRHGDGFREAAREAGLDPERLRVVARLPNPAFTVGWWSPRVFADRELPGRLSHEELVAVLAHEAAHVRRRDPLRLSLLRFLGCMLFWLPAMRALAEDFADDAEILADDVAAGERPLALASAILKLVQWPRSPAALRAGVGFNQRDLLERRVRRLAGQEVEPTSRVTRRSLLGAVLALALALASGAIVAHPLPAHAAHHSEECERSAFSAVLHLLCPDGASGASHHLPGRPAG